jgi:antitoxin ParD1/3/4
MCIQILKGFQNAITEGMNSGLSNKTVPDIMKEVEERMQADGRL